MQTYIVVVVVEVIEVSGCISSWTVIGFSDSNWTSVVLCSIHMQRAQLLTRLN